MLTVLVDYDNVARQFLGGGVGGLAGRIVDALVRLGAPTTIPYDIRFYGGWYKHSNLTLKAQRLIADTAAALPQRILAGLGQTVVRIPVSGSVAQSLLAAPREALQSTYRTDRHPGTLDCRHPSSIRCTNAPCPGLTLHAFVSTGTCPATNCTVKFQDLVSKSEQKLVDTMIVVDLLHLAQHGASDVALVSSDEDMWPGILAASLQNTRVFHLHAKPGRSTPPHYRSTAPTRYREGVL